MGWRRRAFRMLAGVARGLDVGARATLHAAAGLLHPEDLRAPIALRWEDFGRTDAFVRSGLFPWEHTFYSRFLEPDDTVLVVGCGTGRDLLALAKLGYRADGIEPAPAAVMHARATLAAEQVDARVEIGDIETAPLGQSYDVYVFSWYCYSYIPSRAWRGDSSPAAGSSSAMSWRTARAGYRSDSRAPSHV